MPRLPDGLRWRRAKAHMLNIRCLRGERKTAFPEGEYGIWRQHVGGREKPQAVGRLKEHSSSLMFNPAVGLFSIDRRDDVPKPEWHPLRLRCSTRWSTRVRLSR